MENFKNVFDTVSINEETFTQKITGTPITIETLDGENGTEYYPTSKQIWKYHGKPTVEYEVDELNSTTSIKVINKNNLAEMLVELYEAGTYEKFIR
jgi:hypothetical protein